MISSVNYDEFNKEPVTNNDDSIIKEAIEWGECVDKIITENLEITDVVVKTYTTLIK